MKIGIILDSVKVPWFINDLIDWINKSKFKFRSIAYTKCQNKVYFQRWYIKNN